MPRPLTLVAAVIAAAVAFAVPAAHAQLRLRDICRVKGQEENTLQGLGLVVGLKGTGDRDARPTARALSTMMSLMGNPVAKGPNGEDLLAELKDARNVALVFVTATVPPAGARQGDKLNCEVSAVGAKSLDGGHLMLTALLGPRPGSQRVYAFAQGPIHLDDPNRPASGKIHQGCRLEEDFYNVFTHDGRITLVVDKNHAGFQTAQEIAELVNDSQRYFRTGETSGSYLAKALDQVNIEVKIPEHYRDDPVAFVSQILDQRILNPQTDARVVINPRSGSVIIGADVEIGAVAVTHKNVIVETGGGPASQFVPLDAAKNSAKLKTLVETLNAVKVPTADIIEIIKGLERNGKLYGRLIVE